MKVMFDNILVKPYTKDTVTSSGIILEHDKWDGIERGEVILVGEGERLKNGKFKKPEVNVGDYVIYPRDNHRKKIKVDEIECQVLREAEILATIDTLDNHMTGNERE